MPLPSHIEVVDMNVPGNHDPQMISYYQKRTYQRIYPHLWTVAELEAIVEDMKRAERITKKRRR